MTQDGYDWPNGVGDERWPVDAPRAEFVHLVCYVNCDLPREIDEVQAALSRIAKSIAAEIDDSVIAHFSREVCRFPDCKCPMDPGPAPDWCARGLPHGANATRNDQRKEAHDGQGN